MKRRRVEAADADEPTVEQRMSLLVLRASQEAAAKSLSAVVADALRLDCPSLALQCLFWPLPLKRLMRLWGRQPVLVQRSDGGGYFDGLLTSRRVEELLAAGELRYGLHVDVTRYSEAGRRTLNQGQQVADAAEVRRLFHAGCSVRLLHPQRWVDPLYDLLSVLERHFNAPVGCNAYWTPAGTQGFAPHYDDIDALVCQLEGSKRWRLYAPRSEEESLPRFSSPNFEAAQLGPPMAEVVLHPGDVLYMPRGLIHEAFSLPDHHSLHITISTGQRIAWIDLLELAIPAALREAAEEMPELRQTLPRRFLDVMGAMHSDDERQPLRASILAFAQRLMQRVVSVAPLDAAADQIGAQFMRTRARPPQPADAPPRLRASSRVRLAFAGAARLCIEGDEALVVHPFANERGESMAGEEGGDEEEEEEDPAVLAFPLEAAPTLEALLRAYPQPVRLRDLPEEGEVDTMQVAERLLGAHVLTLVVQ